MESLGLDWKLFLAQIVNFGILFFVLSKFIYKPISKLLEERKKKIEESLLNSKKIEERLEKLEVKEKEVIKKAEGLALEKREELLGLAEKEKEEVIESAKEAARRETQKAMDRVKAYESDLYEDIKKRVMGEAVAEVVKTLEKTSKAKNYPMLKKIIK